MKIGVIGAGTMGSGIAQVAAMAGHEVLIYESRAEAIVHARNALSTILNRLAEKGKITDQQATEVFGRIYFLESIQPMSECGFLIEAIVEDLEIKRQLFQSLEKICSQQTVFGTNTSSLSVTAIASGCTSPERVIGVHFFNPAPLMPLVEVVPALQTSPAVIQQTETLMQQWGKTTARTGDTPGFIVNRVARPYYSEAMKIYEERMLHDIPDGISGFRTIDAAMTGYGFKMGPFTLMDFIGHDVNFAVTNSVWKACFFEPRYQPSQTQRQLVDAGWLGKKSGRGFYRYDGNQPEETVQIDNHRTQQIGERILTMLMHEAADAVLKGVASPEAIDLAMIYGANYPLRLLQEVDKRGATTVVQTMDRLFEETRDPRYRCTPLLRKFMRDGRTFYQA